MHFLYSFVVYRVSVSIHVQSATFLVLLIYDLLHLLYSLFIVCCSLLLFIYRLQPASLVLFMYGSLHHDFHKSSGSWHIRALVQDETIGYCGGGGVDLVCSRTSSAGPPTLLMGRCLPVLRLTHCRSSSFSGWLTHFGPVLALHY